MPRGIVKWFNKEKGFGFITPDDGSRDLYMNLANIVTQDHEIVDGERVDYEVIVGRKGPEAIKIQAVL